MRLATRLNHDGTTQAVRIESDSVVPLRASDVGELLNGPDWRAAASVSAGAAVSLAECRFTMPVRAPGKVICVGLNYRAHILEMGRDLPEHPTLFAKYADALIGPDDDIVLPGESSAMDWEGELGIVIGTTARRVADEDADSVIAGYTIVNDVTARDYQYRTTQWLQGKTFEATTPVGPAVLTADEFNPDAMVTTLVDGMQVQRAPVSDLVFGPAALVSYISSVVTLRPGDIIATGTPAGVGHGMHPPRYLAEGTALVTRIDGIGELANVCRLDK